MRARRLAEQLLGGLAHLPVAVLRGLAQRRLDARVVEAGQRHGGPAADRGLVAERGEHGGQAGGVADGAERRHRRLAAARVGVRRRRGGERGHGGTVAPLAQEPGGADDHERVRIAERGGERGGEGRARPPASHGRGRLGGAPAHDRSPACQRRLDVSRRELAQAGQRADRRLLHGGVGIAQAGAGQRGVAPVPGHDDAAPARPGATVRRPVRGNIVAHRCEYVRP